MGKPSAILVRIGFYLILLFSLSVSVFPRFAYILAIAASSIWFLELLIFRDTSWASSSLFNPIAGFAIFSVIAWFLTGLLHDQSPATCVAVFSLFYFVTRGFVQSPEKRKMIVWTFISGVVLASGIDLFYRWGGLFDMNTSPDIAARPLSFLMMLVFCMVIAYYAQAHDYSEKLFFGFVSMPMVILAALAFDRAIMVILLLIFMGVGIFKDRTVLIVVGLIVAVLFSGLFGIRGKIAESADTGNLIEIAGSPAKVIERNSDMISNTGFYGAGTDQLRKEAGSVSDEPFFLNLIRYSGPPSLILFFWIMIERARRDLARIRKVSFAEAKAYHLASLLMVIAVSISSLYVSTPGCSSAILALWMLLGMAEI
jgi:hypothetical protein